MNEKRYYAVNEVDKLLIGLVEIIGLLIEIKHGSAAAVRELCDHRYTRFESYTGSILHIKLDDLLAAAQEIDADPPAVS